MRPTYPVKDCVVRHLRKECGGVILCGRALIRRSTENVFAVFKRLGIDCAEDSLVLIRLPVLLLEQDNLLVVALRAVLEVLRVEAGPRLTVIRQVVN